MVPASYLGLVMLVVNDHYLKARFHNTLTGKLSDVGGLLFFPLLLATIVECARRVTRRRPWGLSVRGFSVIVALTGLMFVLMKSWQPASDLYAWLDAVLQWPVLAMKAAVTSGSPLSWPHTSIVKDPRDLIAIPALALSWWNGTTLLRQRPFPTSDQIAHTNTT